MAERFKTYVEKLWRYLLYLWLNCTIPCYTKYSQYYSFELAKQKSLFSTCIYCHCSMLTTCKSTIFINDNILLYFSHTGYLKRSECVWNAHELCIWSRRDLANEKIKQYRPCLCTIWNVHLAHTVHRQTCWPQYVLFKSNVANCTQWTI